MKTLAMIPHGYGLTMSSREIAILTGKEHNRAMFTPKGVEWIAGLWAVQSLRGEVAHGE